jgi:predicted small metal-binding protein
MLSLALDENGDPCRYMAQAETVDDVVADVSKHIQSVHSIDPADLQNNIRAVTKAIRSKPLGTRAPGEH